MAEIAGIGISGMITPGGDDNNKFATHSDQFGKGGYRAVQTISDRDSITYDRRAIGMEVRVIETGVVYYLESFEGSSKKGVTSQVWKVATSSGEGSDGSTAGGEKEVYTGKLENDIFCEIDERGEASTPIPGKVGYLYLDIITGITYRYNDKSLSFDRINPNTWIDVI